MRKLVKIANAIAIVVIVFASSTVFVGTASAQAVPSGIPFGGTIISRVPSTLICPVTHTLFFDFATLRPFGITTVPGSTVYMNYNLQTPGTFVLGTYIPVAVPCVAFFLGIPYPVFPISQVGTS